MIVVLPEPLEPTMRVSGVSMLMVSPFSVPKERMLQKSVSLYIRDDTRMNLPQDGELLKLRHDDGLFPMQTLIPLGDNGEMWERKENQERRLGRQLMNPETTRLLPS